MSQLHLVMLHGWGQSHVALKPLGELLSKQRELHLLDLPGFGQSEPPAAVWNTFDYADWVIAYLDAANIDKADFLGHSFGGKVAMSIAIRYPHRVNRLILLGASGLQRQRNPVDKCRLTAIRLAGKACRSCDRLFGTALFENHFSPRFGSADYRNAGAMRSILVRSVSEDLSREITTIQAKTLLLWGSLDKETPPEMAHRLHRLIKGSKLIFLSQHGHEPFRDVGAHLSAYHIRPFLAGSL